MEKKDPYRFRHPRLTSQSDTEYRIALEEYFSNSTGSNIEKLLNFPKYVPRPAIMRLLCRYEIYKNILNVQGSVIECGVLFGGGLMTWAQLSAILEPMNHQRRIIGFDTFIGSTTILEKDKGETSSELYKAGDYTIDTFQDLQECKRIHDIGRPLSHIEKVKLVQGDIKETVPQFIKDNPHLVVSLLYLDVVLYEPTAIALEYFVPRMPKGSIIGFDELNADAAPGETAAVIERLGINNLRIQRPTFGTQISYAIVE
jgi:hypothetical protein